LLPSLLDRLTDDDPLNAAIDLSREKIKSTEKKLVGFSRGDMDTDKRQYRAQLVEELQAERSQYLFLTSSIGSLREIRDCVKRDLDWLFNAHNYYPAEQLDDYPEVVKSVLNYGMPDFTGVTASSIDINVLERLIKEAITTFEPRLMRGTIKVRLLVDQSAMDHNAMTFEINSEMWSEPVPIHLRLRTEIELENGSVSVKEA